ncbi:5'-nucleotidase C-terminal domain-containing protein [Treponema sp. OttesenSCG-928-L16]|nr:5'-nucleotidase C-terminal domain-containing protein [Treponema sp. OttesenSCG-928-L16]
MKKNIRWLAPLALVLAGLIAVIGCAGGPKPVEREAGKTYELVLLHTNDHHGTVLPNNGDGGLAERATYIKSVRAANPQVLLVDAGDFNTGSALSNMFNAEPDIMAYNLLGYEVATFGNHEFDGTHEKLLNQISMAEFPFVSSNIKTADGKYLGGNPYIVKNYEGIRVGIIGITTLRTLVIASPDKSLTFVNEIDASKEMVDILRNKEKVDIVIALTHIGNVKEGPDHITSQELAAAVPGIDIIVDAHSHSFFEKPDMVGSTYIVSANEWGRYMGEAKLSVVDGKLVKFDWKPVRINTKDAVTYKADPDVNALLAPYVAKAEASLKEVVGEAGELFVFGDRLTRKIETALGDMICDANVWYFENVYNQKVDFAFHNGGNIRAELPKGPITRERILTILPFENFLYIVSMKGSDVTKLFEFIASIPQGNGGWTQVSAGARYTIDYTGGTGKLKDLTIGGAPVDPNKMYRFSTNSYLLEGGDGYTVLAAAQDPFNTSLLLEYVVCEYIKAQGAPIMPKLDGRIKVVGGLDL